jgi:4-hydroxybutyrate CoA-transferase
MTTENIRSDNFISILNNYKSKLVTADEAVRCIKSHDKIIIHSNCAFPSTLVNAMVKRKDELEMVEIYHALTVGELPYLKLGMEGHFIHNATFIGKNAREAVQDGRADFIPIFLSEIPLLFKNGRIKLDVALIHVSLPDEHGFCSYGVEVGLTKTGAESAAVIIAQVNKNMPRTLGDSFIHVSKIKYMVETDDLIKQLPQQEDITPDMAIVYSKIGGYIADLIEDGSTLQLGIGAIPDAVLGYLYSKKALGIHTEMFSDGVIGLVESGIITNEMKTIHPGKIIAGFVLGTQKLYNFIHNNPLIEFHRQEYVNDPYIISKNYKMVAINSAIEVDITGQVCSDSIGAKLFSGFGGQVDFIRGASRSEGGKPIIALPSSAKNNTISKIVPFLKQGAGVVTSRGDVHYVVTEYGIAQLFGKCVRERVKELVNIAHPDFRDDLMKYAVDNKFV